LYFGRSYGEKPYVCPHYEKWFAHKAQVSMHLGVHTGDKPFGCYRWKKKNFSHKDSLEMHLRMQPGEKPFCCSLCKKWLALYFKTEYFLYTSFLLIV
jgi:KRAB domain-containing zinc finger protein